MLLYIHCCSSLDSLALSAWSTRYTLWQMSAGGELSNPSLPRPPHLQIPDRRTDPGSLHRGTYKIVVLRFPCSTLSLIIMYQPDSWGQWHLRVAGPALGPCHEVNAAKGYFIIPKVPGSSGDAQGLDNHPYKNAICARITTSKVIKLINSAFSCSVICFVFQSSPL